MRLALREAEKAHGRTSPNPAVGAILAVNDRVIARGHHRRAGLSHAEIECFASLKTPAPSNAVLFVTLEPCSTSGRTPPCTDAIIAAGVKRVVVGAIDPNPRHAGNGIDVLRKAGVSVTAGVLASECTALNRAFNKWIQTGCPFVIAKCAMTLDGRLTRPPGEPRWITGRDAREHANKRRASVDAILVGAETIRSDDPRLTVRAVAVERQPWRVVLTRSGRLPKQARIFTDRFSDRTLLFRDKPLKAVLKELGQREITRVLIEGGGRVLGEAFDDGLIDEVELYLAPMFSGGAVPAVAGVGASSTAEGLRLLNPRYDRLSQDIVITAAVERIAPSSV